MTNPTQHIFEIMALGAEGDGIANLNDASIYIPFALPGEMVTLKSPPRSIGKGNASGELATVENPSPARIDPVCQHFGVCGGCRLQHISSGEIERHKMQTLAQALSRKSLIPNTINETVSAPLHTRRRARFDFRRQKGKSVFGFKQRRSHDGIDLKMCPVLTPKLEALVPELRGLLNRLPALSGGGGVQVTETLTGFDIVISPTKNTDLNLKQREILAAWCDEHDIARLCWDDGDGPLPVAARHPAQVMFGDVLVDLPVQAFLQPSADGEALLAGLVGKAISDHCRRPKRIADLFSGCGSLSLPAASATGAIVDTFDIDDGMVAAQRNAANRHNPALRVTATKRDLFNKPLMPAELKPYDAVIFDPPKAGAASQAAELAASKVPLVIAVSCNPSTLARDLRLLVDGGYTLISSTPVDQFTWSGQLEAVAVLTKQVK